MPFNDSGGFTIINTFVPGTTVLSSAVNQNYSDIATSGLSNCLTKDGQQTWAANQKTGGFILTGLGGGTAAGNSVEWQQWQNSTIPVGTVTDFAGPVAPSLWYFCDGGSMLTAAQPALFAVIGYTYGGSGPNFNRPDFRGRVTAGVDNMGGTAAGRIGTVTTDSGTITGTVLASAGGSSTHVQSSGELATHAHTGSGNVSESPHSHSLNGGTGVVAAQSGGASFGGSTGLLVVTTTGTATTGLTVPSLNINNSGSSTAMAWLQPTIMCNKIIFANA